MAQQKQGIDWQTDLYLKLLGYVDKNKLIIDENTYKNISTDNLQSLTAHIFPKYGHIYKKAYQEKVSFFLQCYFQDIITDLPELKSKTINAPKLKEWLNYKQKISTAIISMFSNQEDLMKCLEEPSWNFPLEMRRKILCKIYSIKEVEDIETWMKKKLNNALWFKRIEIYSEIKILLKNNPFNKNDDLKENFHGFTKSEMNIFQDKKRILDSIINNNLINKNGDLKENFHGFTQSEMNIFQDEKRILNSIIRKLHSQSELAPDILLETSNTSESISERSNVSNILPENHDVLLIKNKKIKEPLRKKRKSDHSHENVRGSVLDFFEQEDTSDQIKLFKKLVILCLSSDKINTTLKACIGTGRVSRSTKQMILEFLYDKVKESHYSILDLIISNRYLLKLKVEEIQHFLKLNNINIQTELEGMAGFEDIEPKFYEVLENSNIRDAC